ncbi:MAG: hypothetical protein MJY89_02045 [Bacteroidales bacterium]|nr:hypothetical protein [Bacteroidales bacterium]
MPSSKEYADFIRDRFARLEVVTVRPMMGEYVIHMAGRVLGFISDDRLLLQSGPTIDRLLPDAEKCSLFPGSKLFTIVQDSISPGELCNLAEAIYEDLPVSKPRKSKKKADTPESRFPFVKMMR